MSINNEEEQSVISFGGPSTSSFFGHSYKQGIGFGSDRLSHDESAGNTVMLLSFFNVCIALSYCRDVLSILCNK